MSNILRHHYFAWLAGCAVALAAEFATAPAVAGCNSGNIADTTLLTSAGCQADASGSSATG